ncbi:FMN-binding protein [Isoptericola sp. BMS4]|uniref:FMN-binding protein n=1 Tax=Isoptericola sp. BMS4 TaxID=2527875 RepID=UPI0014227CE2|nr:FMN-binding protein [Isoptericola sp. BMS4]
MTARFRGTLIYVGSLAAIGVAAVARFGLVPADEATTAATGTGSTATGTTPGATGTTSGGTGSSGTGSPSTGSSDGEGSTGGSGPSDTSGSSTTTSSEVTVAGDVAQTRYGPVQVTVTFDGSRIVDVQTVQVPGGHPESEQINAYAAPELAQEVLDAQSAQIHTVSGATYTSEGYRESVQSAIDSRQG